MSLDERVRHNPMLDLEGRPVPAAAYPSVARLPGRTVSDLPMVFDHRSPAAVSSGPARIRCDGRTRHRGMLITWKD